MGSGTILHTRKITGDACQYPKTVPVLPREHTWRFMGAYNPNYQSTHNLLTGLRGLISTVILGVPKP